MRAWLAALILLAIAAAPLRAAETVAVPTPVSVRGGLHEGYGRLVFDWPREVGYEARVDDGRLVIAFDAPAAFEGPVMQRGLEGYAGTPEVADDGLERGAGHALRPSGFSRSVLIEGRRRRAQSPVFFRRGGRGVWSRVKLPKMRAIGRRAGNDQ